MSTPATSGTSNPPTGSNPINDQREQNDKTARETQQMQAENIRFQMLMQTRANAYESRKEAIRSTRSN